MKKFQFTIDEAKKFAKTHRLNEWAYNFLNSFGSNSKFYLGRKIKTNIWKGPYLIELGELKRFQWNDEEVVNGRLVDEWEDDILRFQRLLRAGFEFPPIVVEVVELKMIVKDGNKRVESLLREGVTKYWVISMEENCSESSKRNIINTN